MIQFNFRKAELVWQIDGREETLNGETSSGAVTVQEQGKLNEVGQ